MQKGTQQRPRAANAARLSLRPPTRPKTADGRQAHRTVSLPMWRTRRDAQHGYVVCFELGEATVIAEGGQFAFQVPASDLLIGQRVRFVREGDRFKLV